MADGYSTLEGNAPSGGLERGASRAQDKAESELPYEKFARAGYAAKGVVYVLIGVLAAMVAFGGGGSGQTTGSSGALRVVEGTAGDFLLGLLALGLVGYVLWRMVQAFVDPEDVGDDDWGWAKRVLYFISGVAYGFLAYSAIQMVLGSGGGSGSASGSGGGSTQSMVATILEQPLGQWLVGLVALGVLGRGLAQMWKAYKADFFEKIRYSKEVSADTVRKIGQFGLTARGIVFVIISYFLFQAALQSNPQEAKGLEGVLNTLAGSSGGPWLLGAMALGLVSYGFFQFIKARYRVIE